MEDKCVNSNKMNSNKKTISWILCPSKTFPGKLYYFNVSTGETAWGPGNAEIKIKNNDVPTVPVNHCHPEPSGPPTDNWDKSDLVVTRPFQPAFPKVLSKSNKADITWTPIQNQAHIALADKNQTKEKNDKEVVVQSCDKPLCQRFVNYKEPMIKFTKDNKVENKICLDKIFTSTPIKSQNEPIKFTPNFEYNSKADLGLVDMFQSEGNLSFSDLSLKNKNQKQLIKQPMFNIEVPSEINEVIQEPHEKVIEQPKKSFPSFKITKVVVQSKSDPRLSDISSKIANQRCSNDTELVPAEKVPEKKLEPPKSEINLLQSKSDLRILCPSSKIEKQTKVTDLELTKNLEEKLDKNTIQPKSILIHPENAKIEHKWMKNPWATLEKAEPVTSDSKLRDDIPTASSVDKNLNDNDLRMLLVAKRMKTLSEDKTGKSTNPVKSSSQDTPKKKVRFNPDVIVENISFDGDDDYETSHLKTQLAITVQNIRSLASFGTRDDQWCVIVDTETLLNEFTLIEALVQTEPKCKLLIPARVVTEISSVSIGHGDRARVMIARNVIRRLPSPYIILQSFDDEANVSTHDCILQCCMDALDQNLYVTLIANDEELIRKAKSNSIICYCIQEIKDGVPEPSLQFEPPVFEIKQPVYKQMEITIPNTEIKNTSNEHSSKEPLFSETDDDLNEKEKEIIRNLVEKSQISNNHSSDNDKLANSNKTPINVDDEYSELSKLYSMNFNEKSISNDGRESNKFNMTTDEKFIISNDLAVVNDKNSLTNRFSMASNDKHTVPNEYYDPDNDNSKTQDSYALNQDDFAVSNKYVKDDACLMIDENSNVLEQTRKSDHKEKSMFSRKYEIVNDIPIVLQDESNNASLILNNSKGWKVDVSDISIEEDMRNLNLEDKPICRFALKKTSAQNVINNSFEDLEEIVSHYFQEPTHKLDVQNGDTSNNYAQNSKSFQNIIRNVKSPKNETQTVSVYFQNENKKQQETKTPKHIKKEELTRTFEIDNTSKLFDFKPKGNRNSNFELHKSDTGNSFSKFTDHEEDSHSLNEKTKEFQTRNLESKINPAYFPFKYFDHSKFKDDHSTKKSELFVNQPEINKQKTKEFEIKTLQNVNIQASSQFKIIKPKNFETKKTNKFEITTLETHEHVNTSASSPTKNETKKFKVPKLITKQTQEFEKPRNTTAKFSFQTDSNYENHAFARDNLQFEVRASETGSTFENDKQKVLPVNGVQNAVDLSRFYVKNKVMENRLNERTDEWICTFQQIMEEFLTGVLEELPSSMVKPSSPPWTLNEALQCIRTLYKDDAKVKTIVNHLTGILYETSYQRDKLKQTLSPNDFMKAIGCGIHLIKYLKNILQHSDESHAECHLMTIVEEIENPMTDISEPLDKSARVLDNKEFPRRNFIKNREDIIGYLKNHFPEWKTFDEERKKWRDLKIVRTVGKDLNRLELKNGDLNSEPNEINKVNVEPRKDKKICALTEKQLKKDKEFLENIKTKHTVEYSNAKIRLFKKEVDDVENTKLSEKHFENGIYQSDENIGAYRYDFDNRDDGGNSKLKMDNKILGSKITIRNDFNTQNSETDSKHGYINPNNHIYEIEDVQNGGDNSPKIIRNVNLIEKYEKMINKTSDPDELDYCSMQDSYFEDYGVNNEPKSEVTCCESKSGLQKAAKTIGVPEHYKSGHPDDDSGLGYESPEAYTAAVTSFSAELQFSLDMIHHFIAGSIQEFRDGKIRDETKKAFRLKAFEANYMVTKIIVKLKKLAVKEAKNGSTGFKGTESGDKPVSRKAKVVAECLERLFVLYKTLNGILSATSEEDALSIKSEHGSMSINLSS